MAVSRRPQRWTPSLTDSLTACGLVALSREAGVSIERNGRSAWRSAPTLPPGRPEPPQPLGLEAPSGCGGSYSDGPLGSLRSLIRQSWLLPGQVRPGRVTIRAMVIEPAASSPTAANRRS
jgi:hypothetical protein